jgi:hypothetical protein
MNIRAIAKLRKGEINGAAMLVMSGLDREI